MKEYIDGDLVRYTSLYKEPIAEICEVRETSYLIRFMNGNFARVTGDEIKPIPLTLEILEKNGWNKYEYFDDTFYVIELNCYSMLLVGFPKKVGEDIACGIVTDDLQGGKIISFFPTEVEYVHQLQHLLFGLGINYEIEV